MSYNKNKFYWLQIKEDFFNEDAIEYIEEQENGEKYVLFYLKLCLKSLKTQGILIRNVGNMLIPYDVKKLAEITKQDIDTVRVAMKLLEKVGLIQILTNGEIYCTQVYNMIGEKSVGAFKKQQQRLIAQNIQKNDPILTQDDPTNDPVLTQDDPNRDIMLSKMTQDDPTNDPVLTQDDPNRDIMLSKMTQDDPTNDPTLTPNDPSLTKEESQQALLSQQLSGKVDKCPPKCLRDLDLELDLELEEDIDNIYGQKSGQKLGQKNFDHVNAIEEEATKEKNWETQFEEFWKSYPRKVKKQNTKKWFEKNKPSNELFSYMMNSLEQFRGCADWLACNGKYIPYPSTWLNQRRWEDEDIKQIQEKTNCLNSRPSKETVEERNNWRLKMLEEKFGIEGDTS